MRQFFLIGALEVALMIVEASTSTAQGNKHQVNTPNTPQLGNIQIVTTSDGSTYVGHITEVEGDNIIFVTKHGTLSIPKGHILNIREVPEKSTYNGTDWFTDPNRTRLFFAPTGRTLGKGDWYFADYYLFFPSVNYGVGSRLSLGGGLSIFPSGSMKNQFYFFTPKVALKQSESVNISAGALVLKMPGNFDEDVSLISVLYTVGTYGSHDRSMTLGIGYGLVDGKAAERPLVVLGGEHRLTRRIALVTENWTVPGIDNALVSLGLRFLGEGLSVDLALINTIGKESIFPGIPYVDFVYNF